MKKTRVNLKEDYPKYFATTGITENFAELTDGDIARLDKLEAALPEAQAAAEEVTEKKAEKEKAASPEAKAPVAEAPADESAKTTEPAKDETYAALQKQIDDLQARLDNRAAEQHTTVVPGSNSEGKSKEEPKTYATSVDAELDKFFKG